MNEDTLKKSFVSMAKRLYMEYPSSMLLKTVVEEQDANKTIAVINQWLLKKGNHTWILVFDNVDNPKLPGISNPQAMTLDHIFPKRTKD